ncbi:MAG: hypothetical protein L6305_09180 [Actinomycetia bacterium]|nr:hypothetical protein [bacterium]MBU4509646.1 hypothetical protein [bacterium]MCG2791898.1 hypothetical protein [Actinomycetes bacterium]
MGGNSNGIFSRIYETFFTRDFCFISGGSLLLIIIKYVLDGEVIDLINYITGNFLKFIVFLTFSYIIGVIVQEGLYFTKIIITTTKIPSSYKNYILVIEDIRKNYSTVTLREIERVIFLKQFVTCIGGASLISSIILLVIVIKFNKVQDYFLLCVLILLTIVYIKENRFKQKQQDKIFKDLTNKLKG